MSNLTYHNICRYDNMPFDEYLKLPGLSHSTIKSGGVAIIQTDAMALGSLVDGILTDPASVNMKDPQYKDAKIIAQHIREQFKTVLPELKSQVSYTGEIRRQVEGGYFKMKTKGRIDFLLERHFITDLKVTKSKDIRKTMTIFRYDNQMFNYAGLARVEEAYLAAYSRPTKKLEIVKMDLSTGEEFWSEAVVKYGKFVRDEMFIDGKHGPRGLNTKSPDSKFNINQ